MKKLKAVHLYQYARFKGKHVTFFCADVIGLEGLEINVLDNGLVHIKQGEEEIVVSWTNISYGVPLNDSTAKKKLENRGNLGDMQASSKR